MRSGLFLFRPSQAKKPEPIFSLRPASEIQLAFSPQSMLELDIKYKGVSKMDIIQTVQIGLAITLVGLSVVLVFLVGQQHGQDQAWKALQKALAKEEGN